MMMIMTTMLIRNDAKDDDNKVYENEYINGVSVDVVDDGSDCDCDND